MLTLEEFEDRLGRSLSASERIRAESVIEDVSALVGDVGDDSWTSETVPSTVKAIVAQTARRVFDNPEGAAQKSTGDASISYPPPKLTSDERRRIRKAAGVTMTSVGLVSPWNSEES